MNWEWEEWKGNAWQCVVSVWSVEKESYLWRADKDKDKDKHTHTHTD